MKESGDLRQMIIEVKAITTIENAGSFIADLTIDKQELRLEGRLFVLRIFTKQYLKASWMGEEMTVYLISYLTRNAEECRYGGIRHIESWLYYCMSRAGFSGRMKTILLYVWEVQVDVVGPVFASPFM